ncbi:protein kinase [Streptomyces sp. NBC_00006]|uniref:serine/threonine-protein kinase n=1 Tax=Streptomyces sp. NBC_00006 TaxID=2975619 RepID=UPI00225236B7|nr:protein kinase [Streptomyces sp. NBC_00006]MCX5531967.1 protein kinase [Streptomyces sp. NBC_00006]
MQPLQTGEPTAVGPYRLLGRIGSGGMGRVYLGRSAGGRTVAVKIVHPHFALDDEFRARFKREVQAARRVGGAWTAPVLDADPDAEVPWVATGYVAGPSLTQAAGDGAGLPEHSVRVLGAGLAEALAAVHGLGLVHRDVKPSNVLLTLDGPRLIDFGIARATDGTASLTSTGVSIGSPGYMSPEQILGKAVTGAADVFSLGAVLVYAASGSSPFPGDSSAALLYKVVHEQPELGALTGELREVAAACLSKDPAVRPTPEEVARRLAPEGAARLVQAGWLPGPMVEEVSRGAVRLLDLEGTPADVPHSGPTEFSSPAVSGSSRPSEFSSPSVPGSSRPGEFSNPATPGSSRPAGVFGPPDPAYAPVPTPRTEGPPTEGSPQDAVPGRLSMSVTATSTPDKPNGRGRRVSCTLALSVAGALAAVTVGGVVLFNVLPGEGGGDQGSASDAGPTASAASKAPGVPKFYVGSWDGPAKQAGISFGTFRVDLKQARAGKQVGKVTSTDPLGIQCVDVLTLKSADGKALVAAGKAAPGNPGTCATGRHTVRLTPDGASLKYTSRYPAAGDPTADLDRVKSG